MALEDILESLEEEARCQCEDIMERARRQAEQIIKEAKEEAQLLIDSSAAEAEAKSRSQAAKFLLEARFRARKRIAEAKERIIEEAFLEAERLLGSLPKSPAYKEVFSYLADEALNMNQNGESQLQLRVRPKDSSLAAKFLSSLESSKIEIVGDKNVSPGVVIVADNGRKIGTNTLDSRLAKARRLLRRKVGSLLFSDHN